MFSYLLNFKHSLKGFSSYVILSRGVFLQFFRAYNGETVRRMRIRFRGAIIVRHTLPARLVGLELRTPSGEFRFHVTLALHTPLGYITYTPCIRCGLLLQISHVA